MTVTQDIVGAGDIDDSRQSKRVLLVWDAPNLDMGLGAILGGRPTAAYRPRFDALGRWLLGRTAQLSESYTGILEPEATVFTNIAQGSASLGVAFKTTDTETKSEGFACGISAIVAGVTEAVRRRSNLVRYGTILTM